MPVQDDRFKLEIFTAEKADVYLAYPPECSVLWLAVSYMDRYAIRAITDVTDSDLDKDRVRRIMSECLALVVVLPSCASDPCTTAPDIVEQLRLGVELGLPVLILMEDGVLTVLDKSIHSLTLRIGDSVPVSTTPEQIYGPVLYAEKTEALENNALHCFDQFLKAVLKIKAQIRPYAFYIGRLEQDFSLAREAIKVAVEAEAGIPCLWSDDGRHQIDLESVRESTRLLIKHATFVIADLTLGKENPEHENPSRAHEIGMAIAYGRKLLLCSQEPRRYPYFSIGDMQMTFWSIESDLEIKIRAWIRVNRESLARTVLNYRLTEECADFALRIKKASFSFDKSRRYIGPNTKVLPDSGIAMLTLGASVILLTLTHLANMHFVLGGQSYWMVYSAVIFTVFVWPYLNGRCYGLFGKDNFIEQFFVLVALTLMTLGLSVTNTF